jgi:DNA primase
MVTDMDAVEDIKSRLAIEDVVSEYVQLKRAGRNYKGLSPFGAEKTPSFMVSPEKGIWHDFSSGKGGNMFSFVMEMEGLDFKGALEHLARKAGVDLSQYQSGRSAETGKTKERLYEALEAAARFYQVQFSKNQTTLEYVFKKRQFSKETALEFRIGYSPNNGTALIDYLNKKGFSDKEIQQAGLSAKRYRDPTDMFRGRLMIPLQDPQGKVIGFTARLLEDDPNAPKYINTPQTLLYDKSRHVYGLHLAKESMRKNGYVVVVEGNLDVIASHQAGIRQVVATAGTAMTEMHLKGLNRFTGDIRLSYDQDSAGQAAAERSIPIASKVGVSLSMITIPEGKDPDELIKKDKKLWEKAIAKPQPVLDWLIDRYKAQLDLTTATGKRQFSDILLNVIRQLTDQVEQDHYLGVVGDVIGASKEAMVSKFHSARTRSEAPKRKPKVDQQPDKVLIDQLKTQNHFMALMLMQPALRFYLKGVTTDMLLEEPAQKLYTFLGNNPEFAGDPNIAAKLKPVADYVKILSLQFDELYTGIELLELRNEASRLQARLIEQYVKTQKNLLAQQLREAGETEQTALLEQAKLLDQLLNAHKGG